MAVKSALSLKEDGNILFGEGRYKDALRSYFKAIQSLSLEGGNTDESVATESSELSSRLHGNIGACYLKLEHFESCMGACQRARVISKDPDFVRKLHNRYWSAASRLFLGTFSRQDEMNVSLWIAKQTPSFIPLIPKELVCTVSSMDAGMLDKNMMKTCSKLFDLASKHSLLNPCTPPGVITSMESDSMMGYYGILVCILVMVGFPPTTFVSDQMSKDSMRGHTFPLLSGFIDEVPRFETFHSLVNPVRVPCAEFVKSWLEHHAPPLDIKHSDSLSPVDTTMINMSGTQVDIDKMDFAQKRKGACGDRSVKICPFGPGCECCLRRSIDCVPTKRNLKARQRELERHQSLLEVLCSYGYRSTFAKFTPSNSIFHGGKESDMTVDSLFAQNHQISRACWKLYEQILKSIGEPIPRKTCHVCGSTGNKACSGCPRDEGPIYCSKACSETHWEAGHKFECGLAMPLRAKCVLHWFLGAELTWVTDESHVDDVIRISQKLPDGGKPHRLPAKRIGSLILRIDIPTHHTGRPPMFACDKERNINCFIDPDSEAYAPLLQLVTREGILSHRVYVLAKVGRDAVLRVATRTTSAW